MASVICTSPPFPFFCFLRLLNIFFGKIYLPITALFDGALFIDGFSTTLAIKKLFLGKYRLTLNIPHLDTFYLFTFILAITEDLYFL